VIVLVHVYVHPPASARLRRAEYNLSHLDSDALISSAFGYNEASFRFHEGNAYTHLRDVHSALKAQERALELCPPDNYTDWAMTRLDRAQCLICTGEVAEAVQYAAETIAYLTASRRRGIITLRAKEIIDTLPEGAKHLPAVRDLGEMLMLANRRDGDHYR
jgi:tetratricopeptide (TPR) repeat protein